MEKKAKKNYIPKPDDIPKGIICTKCGYWHWEMNCPVCGKLAHSNK